MSGTAVAGPAQKIAFQRAKESLIKEYLYKTDAEKIKDKKSTPEKEMKEIHMGTLIFGIRF